MSSIIQKDIEIVISRALGTNFQVLSYSLKSFDELKKGILGTHQCLTVSVRNDSYNSNNDLRTHTFFVKTPPESMVIQNYLMDENMFQDEIHFFSKVHPIMAETYKGEKWSPRCYLAKDKLLIFEDLRSQGYTMRPNMDLDELSLKAALSSLARFHASSLLAEEKLGKTLKEAYPDLFEEKMYEKGNKFGQGTLTSYDTIVLIAERFGLDSNLVPKIYDHVYKCVRSRECGFNVVCHGDLWKNNLMFNNSFPPKCILVDYQLLRYTSPAADIGMFLYLHTSPEYRKKSEVDMFYHYYLAFRDALVRSNYKLKIPTYETMLKDYMERRLIGMTYALCYLPGLCLKPDDLEELMNNPVKMEEWLIHSRMNLIRSNMEQYPNYEKQMKDITCELLEEAKRIFRE